MTYAKVTQRACGWLIVGSLAAVLAACAGKSTRSGGGDDGNGDAGETSGGASSRGGTSGRGGDGSGGRGGSAGSAGSGQGGVTNVFVARIQTEGLDKADLLLMIDNSISMASKQQLLAEAIPVLVQRLVDPSCVDASGAPVGGNASGGCPSGSAPELPPLRDIHIGVITSSLGDHGGDVCRARPDDTVMRTLNDQAQLVPTIYQAERGSLYSYQNLGFLVWDPKTGDERPVPDPHPGVSEREQTVDTFADDLATHVIGAGESGCGYEASLEAWYRFLIDPEPVAQVTSDPNVTPFSIRGPVNDVVLQQRAAFLRPDSLLAIVMLTDENDCSILDENNSQGWLVGRQGTAMPRASSECNAPGSSAYRCCRPCVVELEGCPPNASDPQCSLGTTLTAQDDTTNLRCHAQKRRFGVDLLYPWQRYVDGLTSASVTRRDGTTAPNPIYRPGDDGTPARDPSAVFLVGILGVPWQDIADEASLSGSGLRYLTADEMANASPNRWDVILGDPDRGELPLDPFMIESIDERVGTNPILDIPVSPSTSTALNAVNGREQNISGRDDLQYACIFDLVPDVPCTTENQDGCDCNASEQAYQRPTCEYSGDGNGTQTHAKAYPATRQLQVLEGLGSQAVVASICPKNVEHAGAPASDRNYGYNPAVDAMVNRFAEALAPLCLPRPFTTDSDGRIGCTIVEVRTEGGDCSCAAAAGRSNVSSTTRTVVDSELENAGLCGGGTGLDCSEYCACELLELAGSELDACQNDPVDSGSLYGYCYVDPENGVGNPDLVAGCPESQRRILRFTGTDVPQTGSLVYLVCAGS